jgi:predicted small secreted protein
MKNLGLIVLLGSIVCSLSACNTIQGVGEDVAVTGHVIERAATPAPHYYYY